MYYKLLRKGQNCGEVRTSILCQINLCVRVSGGLSKSKEKTLDLDNSGCVLQIQNMYLQIQLYVGYKPFLIFKSFLKREPPPKNVSLCLRFHALTLCKWKRKGLFVMMSRQKSTPYAYFFFCLLITSGWKDQISHMHTNWLPAQIPEAEMCFQRVAQGVTLLVHKERGGWWPTRWV